MRQSANVEHTCFGGISVDRLEYITSIYNSDNVNIKNFKNGKNERDLVDVLLYHPSPITRHEASFVIGELLERGQFEVGFLFKVVKFDSSIVAIHEAVEAMGKVRDPEGVANAYRFLGRLSLPGYHREVYHPDVQATIKESMKKLEKIVKELPASLQEFANYRQSVN